MEQGLSVGVFVVGLVTFGLFSLAVRYHFHSVKMPGGMKVISAVSFSAFVLFAVFLFRQPADPVYQVVSLCLMLVSLSLFGWAVITTRAFEFNLAYDPAAPKAICDLGPYRHVRHPFYLAYCIFWTATFVATLHWTQIATACVLLILYIIAAKGEERGFLASPLADAYGQYRGRTGFIIPGL